MTTDHSTRDEMQTMRLDAADRRRLEQQATHEMRAVEAMRFLFEEYGHDLNDLYELAEEATR